MTINEAICKVIQTQFKKDMGEALKIVEGAGYAVTKWDGRFYVKNKVTNKELCLREGYKGYIVNGNGYAKCKFPWDGICRMDFVGYLNKPFNRDWYATEAMRNDWRTPIYYKYTRLLEAKRAIDHNNKEIERLKKELAKVQENLEYCIKQTVIREQNLKDVRTELRLN